jgi:hypothetical protein
VSTKYCISVGQVANLRPITSRPSVGIFDPALSHLNRGIYFVDTTPVIPRPALRGSHLSFKKSQLFLCLMQLVPGVDASCHLLNQDP